MSTQAILEDLCLKLGMSNLHEKCCKKLSSNSTFFVFDPVTKNKNAESAESFIKCLPTLSVILTD